MDEGIKPVFLPSVPPGIAHAAAPLVKEAAIPSTSLAHQVLLIRWYSLSFLAFISFVVQFDGKLTS